MDKQTTRGSDINTDAARTDRPQWWNDQHTSTWDRVKEALRRDWEQTKNDFSSKSGADLNQGVGDTVKQATGSESLPAPSMKTHPDDPMDAAKRVEKELKERGKVQEKVTAAQTDVAVEQVRAQGKVASEQQAAQEKIANEQRKLAEIAAEAREKVAKDERDTREKLAKQQQKVAEVRSEAGQKIAEVQQKAGERIGKVQEKAGEKIAEWSHIEPAVRYGYGARLQYPDVGGWDDQLEGRLNREWTEMRNGDSWDDVRHHVRRGWDAATPNRVV